ncbi:hypothetical protein [Chitinophaga sp.]|uniref:hypothetical protein n=1 Tax=Chitinophaga sp. TaxID=1869181 RepID=UPI0031D5AB4D
MTSLIPMTSPKAEFFSCENLSQSDACAKEYLFRVLDNGHIYPVTSRSNEGPTFTDERDVWGLLKPDVATLLIREQLVNIPGEPSFVLSI